MGYFKIENVNYKYPLEEKQALKNINIEIKKGEFWAIIGKNGSGKTTFCNMLRRFVPDFYKGELTGKITLEDKELKDYSQKELVQKIGFVFQNPFTQISGVKDTVFEEIAYGLENLGLKKEEIIAFGDNLNDYQMIKFVGKGVAMKNAVEKLKNIADTVTESNNNEGVLKELINVFN